MQEKNKQRPFVVIMTSESGHIKHVFVKAANADTAAKRAAKRNSSYKVTTVAQS